MANRAYLHDTALRSADPEAIRETSAARGLDFAEAATAAYRIPVAWLLPYVSLDALELLGADDPVEYGAPLRTALSGGPDAVRAMKWSSCCEDGALPETPATSYAAPRAEAGADPRRTNNAVALDAALGSPVWFRASRSATRPAPARAPSAWHRWLMSMSKENRQLVYAALAIAVASVIASWISALSHADDRPEPPPAAAADR